MVYVIENKPLEARRGKHPGRAEFWAALKSLEVGQSFQFIGRDSNVRNGITIAEHLLDRGFSVRKEPDSEFYRVYRTL